MVSLYAMKSNDNDFALNDNGWTEKMSVLAVIVFLLQSERNMKFVKRILAASHKKYLICSISYDNDSALVCNLFKV